jgi:hypothetical protein
MVSDRRNGIYRCIIVAAFGWLSLAASNPPKQAAHPGNPAPQGEITKAANTVATAIAKAEKTPEKDRGCDQGKDERNSDLCAQWKAADAARDAANYAFWALFFGVVGTGLLVWTLWETRVASRNTLRAYLAVDAVTATVDDGFKAQIKWINCGATPAHNIRAVLTLDIAKEPDFSRLGELEPSEIHLGAQKFFFSRDSLMPEAFGGRDAVAESVWLYARVTYRDIFNKPRKTDVCLKWAGATEFGPAARFSKAT